MDPPFWKCPISSLWNFREEEEGTSLNVALIWERNGFQSVISKQTKEWCESSAFSLKRNSTVDFQVDFKVKMIVMFFCTEFFISQDSGSQFNIYHLFELPWRKSEYLCSQTFQCKMNKNCVSGMGEIIIVLFMYVGNDKYWFYDISLYKYVKLIFKNYL